MRKALTMASLLALLAFPAWAGGIGIMYSAWDTDDVDNDHGVGLKLKLDLGSALDLEVRGAWLDSLEFTTQGDVFKLEATPIDVGLAYGFRSDRKVRPFVGAGPSFVLLNGKVHSDSAIRVDDEMGFYAVAGFDFSIGKRGACFAEVLYRDVSAEFTSDGLLNRDFDDFGASVAGVGLNLGLMLSW